MSNRHAPRPAHSYSYDEPASASSCSYDAGSVTPTDKDASDSFHANSASGSDSQKHRRSRSGCYTCRGRRVKCDETRPICERCRKGKRSCIYPEPPRPTRPGQRSKPIPEEAVASTEDQDNLDDNSPSTQDILRGDESDTPSLTYSKSLSPPTLGSPLHLHSQNTLRQKHSKDGNARLFDRSPSSSDPSASLSPPHSHESPSSPHSEPPRNRPNTRRLRSDLSPTLRFYLDYQRNHMSFYHYGLTLDHRSFVHSYLITQALNNDALLYAVVAFAAYHHAVRKPNSTVHEFLPHYTRSLTLLRNSLEQAQKGTVAHLLTVLQLAVLEEHLGDWVTLAIHQKAAYRLLTTLYKPETMLQDDIANKILEWYIRFDLFVGFIAGTGATLNRVWFEAQHRYYIRQVREYAGDLGYKWDERNASARLLAKDVAHLFSERAQGNIDDHEFSIQASDMSRRFAAWYRDLPPAIMDPSKIFKDVPRESVMYLESSEASAVAVVYGDELWPTNHMLVHFWGVELMFNHKLATMQHRPTPPDVASLALKICQMFEAVEKADPEPGALLGVHAATSMCSMFLSRKPQLQMWFRRKQVQVESNGYVYPTKFRHRMSLAWGADVSDWWLPNGEGQTSIMQQVRGIVEDRSREPSDDLSRELKDMNGIFAAMKFSDEL